MDNIDFFEQILTKLGRRFSESKKLKLINFIKNEYQNALADHPRIAVIGKTGVGKSSTINALFQTDLPVSHTKSQTLDPIEISINMEGQNIKGAKGNLIIYDMPGLGESRSKKKRYEEIYADIIYKCDVALWIIAAPDRSLGYDQDEIERIVSINKNISSRIVIGINKVDLIKPADWNIRTNLPSKIQEKNMYEILDNVKSKMLDVCPELTNDRIVAYSAEYSYRLEELFGAMLKACSVKRAWVLSSRENMDSYLERVDPEIRKMLEHV